VFRAAAFAPILERLSANRFHSLGLSMRRTPRHPFIDERRHDPHCIREDRPFGTIDRYQHREARPIAILEAWSRRLATRIPPDLRNHVRSR